MILAILFTNSEGNILVERYVYIVYMALGDVSVYVVGKDEYDEFALAEVIFVITLAVKDVCGKLPTERLFLDKYRRICLTLDEIIWKDLFLEVSTAYQIFVSLMVNLNLILKLRKL
nr:unnamed protein product [Gossypium raimondii]